MNQSKPEESSTTSFYLYLKSFSCSYNWSLPSSAGKPKEQFTCEVIHSDQGVSWIDLYRVGWSRQMFDQFHVVYSSHAHPYTNSIKRWLLVETRKVTSREQRMLTRPTVLADKLAYRNVYYNARLKNVGTLGTVAAAGKGNPVPVATKSTHKSPRPSAGANKLQAKVRR